VTLGKLIADASLVEEQRLGARSIALMAESVGGSAPLKGGKGSVVRRMSALDQRYVAAFAYLCR
jgi:hypothetical protein